MNELDELMWRFCEVALLSRPNPTEQPLIFDMDPHHVAWFEST